MLREELPEDSITHYERLAWETRVESVPPLLRQPTPTREQLDYWSTRAADQSEAPHLRARYADLVWSLGKSESGLPRGRFAIVAIECYLEVAASSDFQPRYREHAVSRAIDLAKQLNHDALKIRAAEAWIDLASSATVRSASSLGWLCTRLVDAGAARKLPAALTTRLVGLCEAALDDSEATTEGANPVVMVDLDQELRAFMAEAGLSEDRLCHRARATTKTILARGKEGHPLVLVSALTRLRPELVRLGLTDMVAQVDLALTEAGRRAEVGMATITASGAVPRASFDMFVQEVTGASDAETLLILCVRSLVRPGAVVEETNTLGAQFPLQSLCTTVTLGHDGRPIAARRGGDPGKTPESVDRKLIELHLGINASFAEYAARELLARRKPALRLMIRAMEAHLSDARGDRRALVEATSALLRERWFTATTLFALLIEPLLLQVAVEGGLVTHSANAQGGLNTASVDSLLESPSAPTVFGRVLWFHLRHIVFGPNGLRHSIAHGQMPASQASFQSSFTALQSVVLLGQRLRWLHAQHAPSECIVRG